MIGFNQGSAATGNVELVPANTLSHAAISFEETRFTKPNEEKGTAGGGRYLNCKITLVGAPNDRRVIFHSLFDPEDPKNSEGGRSMGLGHLVRIMEAMGIFDVNNPASYRPMSFDQAVALVTQGTAAGKHIAVEVGVQKGTGGYQDKNVVRNFLTPNPKSDTFLKWKKLQGQAAAAGGAVPVAGFGAPAAPASPFGAPQAAPVGVPFGQSAPGWLAPGAAAAGQTKLDDEIPF